MSECRHRTDLRRATRRQIARDEGDDAEKQADPKERNPIEWMHAIR
jgi:hypothetical protein